MGRVENLEEYLANISQRLGGPRSEGGLLMGQFLGEIDRCIKERDFVALQKCTDALIHFLPENVSSLSILVKEETNPKIITSEKDCIVSEEKQEHWGLFELIRYTTLSDLYNDGDK